MRRKKETPPDLDSALRQLQARHVVLIPAGRGVKLWPAGDAEPSLKRVVYKHRAEVLRLIDLAEIRVCPSPDMHRHSYSWQINRYCCDTCARLRPYVS